MTAAVRIADAPLAIPAAVRAIAAGGTLLVLGVLTGNWDTLSVAYFGAACSVAFAIGVTYRVRVMALLASASGAAVGLVAGCWSGPGTVSIIVVAVVAGAVSGLVGPAGPHGPAFGMMLAIGVAFGQFGASSLAPLTQAAWYLIGAAVVAVVHVVDWPFRRRVPRRRSAANVFTTAAQVCASAGRDDARDARLRLMAAFAAARTTGWSSPVAKNVAYAAAAIYAEREPVPDEVVEALQQAAQQVARGEKVQVATAWPAPTAGLRAMAAVLQGDDSAEAGDERRRIGALIERMRTPAALLNALRSALCLGIATAVTLAMHDPKNAIWLPLTVAVIVRPEYASIVVRTLNRVAGTLVGAAAAAAVLAIWPSGIAVAVAATLGLAFAALTAPKLYGLSVIGITLSALLSMSVGVPDPAGPAVRLLDTVVGAAIAVVFGYLLWPGARRLPQRARLDDGLVAADEYLREAMLPEAERTAYVQRRDTAYQLAHDARAACVAALAEPPPVPARAREMLPRAIELEEIVDEITTIAVAVDNSENPKPQIHRTQCHLDDLRAVLAESRSIL